MDGNFHNWLYFKVLIYKNICMKKLLCFLILAFVLYDPVEAKVNPDCNLEIGMLQDYQVNLGIILVSERATFEFRCVDYLANHKAFKSKTQSILNLKKIKCRLSEFIRGITKNSLATMDFNKYVKLKSSMLALSCFNFSPKLL